VVVLHAFADAVDACEHADTATVLGRLLDLFALSTVESERAWFHEHGRLTAARSKAVVAEVNALCGRLRPVAVELVEAFAIPEAMIAAAILRTE
jgi:acyl-CoA oxidase